MKNQNIYSPRKRINPHCQENDMREEINHSDIESIELK